MLLTLCDDNGIYYNLEVSEEDYNRVDTDHDFALNLLREASEMNTVAASCSSNSEAEVEHAKSPLDEVGEHSKTKSFWEYEDVLKLIASVGSRQDELHHPKKRRNFWSNVANDLESEGVLISAEICSKKWKNLLRTYYSTKEVKRKTGRGSHKFKFFDAMDNILGDKPNVASPHTIDVASTSKSSSTDCSEENKIISDDTETATPNRKRKSAASHYYEMKRERLVEKDNQWSRKRREDDELKVQKTNLWKKKLELEERKVAALEKFVALKERELQMK